MNEGVSVKGYFGTDLPPNKNHPKIKIDDVSANNYDLLIIPGGVKQWKKSDKI